ncbi:MAG: hypothetical protein AB1650_02275 [Candidatus Omnitrophota bacterium]
MSIDAIQLTDRQFRPFGKLIHYAGKEKKGKARNLWRILHRETAKVGWRVAYLVLRDRSVGRLESHPDSDETFEPVRGAAVLIVAPPDHPEEMTFFRLDAPVIVFKGVWHGVISLTPETELKITENLNVYSRVHKLGKRIGISDKQNKL